MVSESAVGSPIDFPQENIFQQSLLHAILKLLTQVLSQCGLYVLRFEEAIRGWFVLQNVQ